jgi:N-acetylglucosaminyldiphosphoundecaprenol N-acetyl-beta-D-mannosaminyltransferase
MTTTIEGPPSSLPTLRFVEHLASERRVPLLDLRITDATYPEAARLLDALVRRTDRARMVHFVNAHTLNHAHRSEAYRGALARAEHLFGDGTGVRWAVRALQGVHLRANLNGTDLIPYFMREKSGAGRRVFLLGTRDQVLRRAVLAVEEQMPGWQVCGFHDGFFQDADDRHVVGHINAARPDLLLVAMGNPRQETWIDRNLHRLDVPLSMGVGALFDYWAGAERRAPAWMCRAGMEWLYRMFFQRGKFARYFLGNPEFIWNVLNAKWSLRHH